MGHKRVATGPARPEGGCLALAWAQKDQDSVGYQQALYRGARGWQGMAGRAGRGPARPGQSRLSRRSSPRSTASARRDGSCPGAQTERHLEVPAEVPTATARPPLHGSSPQGPALAPTLLRPPAGGSHRGPCLGGLPPHLGLAKADVGALNSAEPRAEPQHQLLLGSCSGAGARRDARVPSPLEHPPTPSPRIRLSAEASPETHPAQRGHRVPLAARAHPWPQPWGHKGSPSVLEHPPQTSPSSGEVQGPPRYPSIAPVTPGSQGAPLLEYPS